MYRTLKRAILNVGIRFAYREKLRDVKRRMRRLDKKEKKLNELILRWESRVNTASSLSDKALQESEQLWGKLRVILHEITLIGSVQRNAAEIKAMVYRHVESTRKDLMN